MTCFAKDRAGAEVLMDFCSGMLDPAQAAGVEQHIRECSGCREAVDAQRGLWQTLDAWKPIEVSRDFDARLYARIAQADAEPWYLRMWKPVVSVAALATVVAVMFVARPGSTVAPPAPTTQKINIQEVQQALDDLDLLNPAAANVRSPL